MAEVEGEFSAPFRARGDDIARIFYYGESVLLPPYRGTGIGRAFFEQREAGVHALGPFARAAFCAVVRPADHPLRPKDYVPLDAFWRRRGFEMASGLVGSFAWKDIDQPDETPKPMQYWVKELV
jgi:GNAT superfamily N-acetyltransferase